MPRGPPSSVSAFSTRVLSTMHEAIEASAK